MRSGFSPSLASKPYCLSLSTIFFFKQDDLGWDFRLLRRTFVGYGFSNGFCLFCRRLLCLSLFFSLLIWIKTRKEQNKIKKDKIGEHLGGKRLGVIGIVYLFQKGLGSTFADMAMLIMKVLKTSAIFEIIFFRSANFEINPKNKHPWVFSPGELAKKKKLIFNTCIFFSLHSLTTMCKVSSFKVTNRGLLKSLSYTF